MKTLLKTLTALILTLAISSCSTQSQPNDPNLIGLWKINTTESDPAAAQRDRSIRTGEFAFEINDAFNVLAEGENVGRIEKSEGKNYGIFVDADGNQAAKTEITFLNANKIKLVIIDEDYKGEFIVLDRVLIQSEIDAFRKEHQEKAAKRKAIEQEAQALEEELQAQEEALENQEEQTDHHEASHDEMIVKDIDKKIVGQWKVNPSESDPEVVKSEINIKNGSFAFNISESLKVIMDGQEIGSLSLKDGQLIGIFPNPAGQDSTTTFTMINENKIKVQETSGEYLVLDRVIDQASLDKMKKDAAKKAAEMKELEERLAKSKTDVIGQGGIYSVQASPALVKKSLDNKDLAEELRLIIGKYISFERQADETFIVRLLELQKDGRFIEVEKEFPYGSTRKGVVTQAVTIKKLNPKTNHMNPVIGWIYDEDTLPKDGTIVLEIKANGDLILGGDFEEEHLSTLVLISRDLSKIQK